MFFRRKKRAQERWSIWLNSAARLQGLLGEIKAAAGSPLLLIAHFPEALAQLAEQLQAAGAACESPNGSINLERIHGVMLVLAEQLPTAEAVKRLGAPTMKLHVAAIEPHPLAEPDDQLRALAAELNLAGPLTFHAALDDPLLSRFGGERMVGLMESLGMTADSPVSGAMLEQAVKGAQKKIKQQARGNRPAASAEEWLKLNL